MRKIRVLQHCTMMILASLLFLQDAGAEALPAFPGWSLESVSGEESENVYGEETFLLVPADGRLPLEVNANQAARLRAGGLNPEQLYARATAPAADKKPGMEAATAPILRAQPRAPVIVKPVAPQVIGRPIKREEKKIPLVTRPAPKAEDYEINLSAGKPLAPVPSSAAPGKNENKPANYGDIFSACAEGSVCDTRFTGRLVVLHPNPSSARESAEESTTPEASDLFAVDTTENKPTHWEFNDLWSSYPLIRNSAKVGALRRVSTAKPTDYNEFVRNTMKRIASAVGQKIDGNDLSGLRVMQSPTHAVIVNGDASKEALFGNVTYAFNTWKEYFGNNARGQVLKKLKGKKGVEAKAVLKAHLIRDEDGKADTEAGKRRCVPIDRTFEPGGGRPSEYCKHPHFQLAPRSFAGFPLSKKKFSLGITVRLIHRSDQAEINEALSQADLSSYYAHMNLRVLLRRTRKNPLPYRYPVGTGPGLSKTEDRIVLSLPLFQSNDFCLNNEFAKGSPKVCAGKKAGPKESTIAHRPDYGTLQFMYKFGLKDLVGEKKANAMLRNLANGRWVRYELRDVPRFSEALREAAAGCKKGQREWGIPAAICDIESFDLEDYSVNTVNIGAEVSGAWDIAVQLRDFKFQAK